MNKGAVSDLERNNRVAMVCHLVEAIIISISYIVEMILGKRTFLYVLIIMAFAMAPVIAELIFWSRDHETTMVKHLVAQGFAVMYTVMLFTTTNQLTFLYVIPMILIISVYNDAKYSILINTGCIIENFIAVIGGAMFGKFGYRDLASGILQLIVMVLVGVYSYFTAKTLEENNQLKLLAAKEAYDKTETILGNVSQMSKTMWEGINEIHARVENLQQASQTTKEAMEEVTAGATDTAEAVQRQLMQTEKIGQRVEQVSGAATDIAERMHQTLEVLESGNRDVEKLVAEVENSVSNGEEVAGKLETLNQYIEEMNSIVELISGITSQTSLLALNASIEAARAGEAGRGFAVVATEISALATQTKEATTHITKLIENVSGSIGQVVTVIRDMIDGINEEKESTENTAASFATIEKHTYAIRDNVAQLTESVEQLQSANQEIADSVQTISAVSEEVSAHANETLEAEEANMENLMIITGKSQELIAMTQGEMEQ